MTVRTKLGGRRIPVPLNIRQGMRALHAVGFSCREIGKLFVRRRETVQRIVGKGWKARESKRGRHGPPPRTFSERWYHKRARDVYQKHHGVRLRANQHVHHIDHNYKNFQIINLMVLSAKEHGHHHHPPNPVPRWLRPGRQAYMRKYMETYHGKRSTQA